MSKRGKKYREQLAAIDSTRLYTLEEAVNVLKSIPHAGFDETVELHFKLGIDPRQSDQNLRGAISLPHGTGKTVRVVVIADGEAAEAARAAGADEVGFEELIERIKNGWLEFDSLIATPAAMPKLRPLGRLLGPRGLMPNPKTGTVTDDPAAAVKAAKAGRVEYRNDRGGALHVPVGKISFEPSALIENAKTVIDTVQRVKPPSAKGTYLVSVTICTTMSPGIKLDPRQLVRS